MLQVKNSIQWAQNMRTSVFRGRSECPEPKEGSYLWSEVDEMDGGGELDQQDRKA